jgi:hypothetical protein
MIENILVSAAITLLIGFPLSIYAGVIVIRFASFDNILNQARTLLLNLDHDWEYRHLSSPIPDPQSPTGNRSVFMSDVISSNHSSWQLTQLGLALKELGHWKAAKEVDSVWLEMDSLRDGFIEQAESTKENLELCILEYIAEWHRTISCGTPDWWCIIKPWPMKRYQHLSSIEVDEDTGEWREIEPQINKNA